MRDTTRPRPPHEAIARIPGETPKAYGAFVQYAQMGPERSLARLTAALGKTTVKQRQFEAWSVRWQWQRRVTGYDDTIAADAARAHAKRYREELEDHRKRYGSVGKALYSVSLQLLSKLNEQKDDLELTPNALAVVARALIVAGDLEAHALGIDRLLSRLSEEEAPRGPS